MTFSITVNSSVKHLLCLAGLAVLNVAVALDTTDTFKQILPQLSAGTIGTLVAVDSVILGLLRADIQKADPTPAA